jgi:hypothetical protein
VFLINSRLGRFSATRFGSPRIVDHLLRAPLLPKLRGHFAEFLFRGSLEHLRLLASPTCVRLRYGRKLNCPARLFSAVGSTALGGGTRPPSASALGYSGRICLSGNAYHLASGHPSPDGYFAPASPLGVITRVLRYGIINPFPIAYALRPRLRDRLTRSG